jgi:hypothetical protein
MSRADDIYAAIQADPVGVYQQLGAELEQYGYQTTDPRVAEMYASYNEQRDLQTYDAYIEQICAANPDVDGRRFHRFVSAAEGNFDLALQLYRADRAEEEARVRAAYGLDGRQPDATAQAMARAQAGVYQQQTTGTGRYGYEREADGRLTPQGQLHASIDEVMRLRRERR